MCYNGKDTTILRGKTMFNKRLSAKIKISENKMYSVELSNGNRKTAVYEELSSNEEAIRRFVDAINRGDVSPIHIDEMIEDIIG